MSDKKNIDTLFREKLGDTREVPYNEGAWEKMADILDKNTPGNISGTQQGFIATIGILFALSFSFFTQTHPETPQNIASEVTPLEIVSEKAPENTISDLPEDEAQNTQQENQDIIPVRSQNNATENTNESSNSITSENTTHPTAIPASETPTTQQIEPESPTMVMAEEEEISEDKIKLTSRDIHKGFLFSSTQRGLIYVFIPGIHPMKNRPANLNIPKSTLYLTGGMIISRTFTGNAFSLRTAYAAPMGGFGYSKQLSHRWSVWGEMYYHERSGYGLENVEEVEGEGRLIYYEEEVESVKSGQNIHLLLGGRYNISKKHSIAIGGYAGYLLQTTRARRTVIYADQIIIEPHPDPVYGREGLSHWDAGLLLDYGFSITPRWELALRYQQGFIDQSNANFFYGAGRDLTQQYGVLLRWKFRK